MCGEIIFVCECILARVCTLYHMPVCICMFLIAVHCDITVWYMTSVMCTNRSIYLFTPERPRDLSARALLAPPSRSSIIPLRALRSSSFETSQDGVNISEHISNALPQSKEFCVLFALYGLVSYPG